MRRPPWIPRAPEAPPLDSERRVGPLPQGPLACLRQTIECFRGTASGAENKNLRLHERLLTRLPAGLGRSRGEGGRSASIITIDRLEVAFSTIANRFGPSVENDSRRWVHPAPNDKSRLPAFCRITCYNRGPSPPRHKKLCPPHCCHSPASQAIALTARALMALGRARREIPEAGSRPRRELPQPRSRSSPALWPGRAAEGLALLAKRR